MKTNLTRCAAFVALLWTCTSVYAQQLKYNLGNAGQFVTGLQQQEAVQKENGRSTATRIVLDLNPSTHLEIQVNYSSSANGRYAIRGQVAEMKGTNVFLDYENGNLSGSVIIGKNAYSYSSDAAGNAYVEPVDINDVICVEYGKDNHEHAEPAEATDQQDAAELDAAEPVAGPYDLQSLPGSPYVVYLDYDGYYLAAGSRWNNGNPINAAPSGFSDAKITESWEIAAEDFRPFNINVTTSLAVFNASAAGRRMRVVITPTTTAAPGSGGVAYIGSFNFLDEDPCWVFNLGTKSAGETISHEVGHTLYLRHDGRTSPAETYYGGHGTWGPIMGASFSRPVVQWSKGEYSNANNTEDDLNIITTRNGFGYRTDAVGGSTATARVLSVSATGTIASYTGIIERNTDLDYFRFTTTGGILTLNANPAARHGNLDILIRLYNSAGTLLATANGTSLAATLTRTLAAGTYYFSIDGTSYLNPLTTGYSGYGSIGRYTVSGNVNKVPTVTLTGPTTTTYTSPATITLTATAADANGTVAKVDFYRGSVLLATDVSAPYSYTWTGVVSGTYTLTAKSTDNLGAVSATSNSITVKVNSTCTGIAQYVENGGYVAGSKVQNGGRIYECQPWPNSGWCNGPASAYAPGTGSAWTDAWTLTGVCTARIASSQSNAIASPNPTTGLLTINVENTSTLEVLNSYGIVMIAATEVSGSTTVDLSALPSGIYILKIDNGTEVIMEKIVKD